MPEPSSRAGSKTKYLFGAALLVVAGGLFADWRSASPPDALANATFVGRQSCVDCHQQEHADWTGSHHDKAMDLATDETVLADFNDASFDRFGVATRFFRDGERFMVYTEGPDGEPADFEVKYTFGVEPLQQYMVELPDGRVQVLRWSWDTYKREWFYLLVPGSPDERVEPGDPFHWTGVTQNWNTTCAECHSTNLQKNFDLATNTYDTTYSEIDVSCEECHGPASLHVELATANSLFWDRRHGYGLAKLKGVDPTPQIEACAKCHARRNFVHGDFRPGSHFMDSYDPALLSNTLYHADGQILDEVYVYGSFLQSKMHAKGVRCTDCHNPHSLELESPGNRMCAKCHEPAKYDVVAHHHHPIGDSPELKEATQCVSCHMPATTYMMVDPRRDHSFRVPRPDLTIASGAPNACNRCHTKEDEDAEWAAAKVVEWYGEERPDDPHWAPAFAAGRRGDPEAVPLLRAVFEQPTKPPIVRATAIELLQQYPTATARETIAQALGSPEPLIRLAAVRATGRPVSMGPGGPAVDADRVQRLTRVLRDPSRSVRAEAARLLAGEPAASLFDDDIKAFNNALDEYRAQQAGLADRAGAHRNLANLARLLGDQDAEIAARRTAIRLEPYLSGPRAELATALNPATDSEEITRLRREEVEALQRDIGHLPDSDFLYFQLAVVWYQLGEVAEAESAFSEASRLNPTNADYLVYLSELRLRLYATTRDEKYFTSAVEAVRGINRLRPNDPGAEALLRRLLAMREAFNAQEENAE